MLIGFAFTIIIALCYIIHYLSKEASNKQKAYSAASIRSVELEIAIENIKNNYTQLEKDNIILKESLEHANYNNSTILSQKKSSETRTGQIGENFSPFLEGFNYDPKSARFLASPIDFIIFDLNSADPAIVFLEVKTGNAKLSAKQKLIRNLVRTGKVRFEEYRISTKGTNTKVTLNEDKEEDE